MWLPNPFQCWNQPTHIIANPLYKNFMGAGCVFTDGHHVLAGYQPNKKNPCITGIGGHKEQGEDYLQTAFRETVEEIFDVKQVPPSLLEKLTQSMVPKKTTYQKGYVILQFDFEDYKVFLQCCKKTKIHSPLFLKSPTTLLDSIQQRKVVKTSEITHLCLLPVIKDFQGKQVIHPAFLQDMKQM